MKIKEDILRWKMQIQEFAEQNHKTLKSVDELKDNVEVLTNQVDALFELTKEMTDAMLSLIRQQLGD